MNNERPLSMADRTGSSEAVTNGAALAAFLGAGIGAFAMGMIVILNEVGWFAAPALYGPAGGVSGRTTFAVVIWRCYTAAGSTASWSHGGCTR